MNTIGQSERETQNRVIRLFRDELGYRYLGDGTDRDGFSNIDERLLTAYLIEPGPAGGQCSLCRFSTLRRVAPHRVLPFRLTLIAELAIVARK
ncbi:MAG: hypothetical protein KJ000_22585 [Pirellulaceae bacterium]|nr:hypothetical protein [Pirellulaceae bacterium]